MNGRRARNEKKPIPDVLKDEKYYERRRRNNAAAKKSRDARKNREDEIATRASFLEKENAVLRAQVAALREVNWDLGLPGGLWVGKGPPGEVCNPFEGKVIPEGPQGPSLMVYDTSSPCILGSP